MLVRHLPDNASNIKCQQMLLKFDPQAKDWQMGHTKVREFCNPGRGNGTRLLYFIAGFYA